MTGMPEIWVTPRSCSECLRDHSDDGHGDECDCWCHDESYAELQAEHLAAADLDPDWPATYE